MQQNQLTVVIVTDQRMDRPGCGGNEDDEEMKESVVVKPWEPWPIPLD